MNQRIIVVTTDGDSREDGNVYYAGYYLAEHPTLDFSEKLFTTETSDEEIISHIEALGYVVHRVQTVILTTV